MKLLLCYSVLIEEYGGNVVTGTPVSPGPLAELLAISCDISSETARPYQDKMHQLYQDIISYIGMHKRSNFHPLFVGWL